MPVPKKSGNALNAPRIYSYFMAFTVYIFIYVYRSLSMYACIYIFMYLSIYLSLFTSIYPNMFIYISNYLRFLVYFSFKDSLAKVLKYMKVSM